MIFLPDAVAGWGFPMAMLTYNAGQGLLALGTVLAVRARERRHARVQDGGPSIRP